MNPQEMYSCIKQPRELDKRGCRKKSKVIKTSLETITLMEGILHDIGEKIRDVTVKAL